MIGFTDLESPRYMRLSITTRNLINPWRLPHLIRDRPEAKILLLREFLLLPFLLALPVLWRYRLTLVPVAAHNVQRARTRRRDRWAFKLLSRIGFRFILPESSEGLGSFGLGRVAQSSLVLPLAVTEQQSRGPKGPKQGPTVGIIGRRFQGKSLDSALDLLRAAVEEWNPDATILVGRPGDLSSDTLPQEVVAVDTRSEAGYRQAMARCSVVFLDYDREHYEYRPSATILDAIAANAAVVCPDFPVFNAQVNRPIKVGVTFRTAEEIPQALCLADELSTQQWRFNRWIAARQQSAIAATLRESWRSAGSGRWPPDCRQEHAAC